jgi:hypothetical protein
MMLLLSACSTGDNVKVAKEGVEQFHSALNAKQFDTILMNASQEYRNAVTVEQNQKLFRGVQKKLGDAKDWSVTGWFVNFTPSGTIVRLTCKTKFALGEADESFVWRISGNSASLVGYNVNSLALVSE